MIDFKYHLVSLISVFMALAIGVVLGAGPLQESIGNSLAEQVSTLRGEKEALQNASRAQQDLIDDYDTYLDGATDELVTGRLKGQRVTLVRMDDVPGDVVQTTRATIATAGGTVSGEVTVAQQWADPDSAADRSQAAAALATAIGESAPGGDPATFLNRVLAESIAVPEARQAGSARPQGERALQSLRSSDLISLAGTPAHRSDLIIVLAGPHPIPASASDEEKAADEQTMAHQLALVQAIDRADRATVVAGPRRSAQTTSLVATVRADKAAATAISGVDDVDHPMGQISLMSVSRSRLGGTVEQVGTAGDAKSLVPQLITRTVSSPSPTTDR